jgi:uncharacterized protein (TIGR02594 family)
MKHLQQPGLPLLIQQAMKYLNVSEIKGPASNEVIMRWATHLGLEKTYTNDDIAWCGLFVAYVVKRSGREPIENPLWARNWRLWGVQSPTPSLGDILVFKRLGGGGHVGFYVAEDAKAFHVLGGNQKNRVSIVRIDKERLIDARRPIYTKAPATAIPYIVSAKGSLSTDEA